MAKKCSTVNKIKWHHGVPLSLAALMGDEPRRHGIQLQAALNARLSTKGPISETNNKIQLTMKRKKLVRATKIP